MTPSDDDKKWHLDRKVPIAIIVTLAVQTAGFAFWTGALSQRVEHLERREVATAPHAERLIRLETRMESIADHLVEIRNILRREPRQ